MKNKINRLYLAIILFAAVCTGAYGQHNHGGAVAPQMNMNQTPSMNVPSPTANLKVWGKCEMCKSRIEKVALASGAESAEWDVKTKSLKVGYKPGATNLEYIGEKLAKAGHDNGLVSAKDKAYNALPECCKYERIR